MISDVRSYLLGSIETLKEVVSEAVSEVDEEEEVEVPCREEAITRKVVRSNMMTSEALHMEANVDRCRDISAEFGMRVCTTRDHA